MPNLDSKDHKILYHLFKNSIESLSFIGKKGSLPKTVVKYRIERLVNKNIIKKFYSYDRCIQIRKYSI